MKVSHWINNLQENITNKKSIEQGFVQWIFFLVQEMNSNFIRLLSINQVRQSR